MCSFFVVQEGVMFGSVIILDEMALIWLFIGFVVFMFVVKVLAALLTALCSPSAKKKKRDYDRFRGR